jgi:hypothetical protein
MIGIMDIMLDYMHLLASPARRKAFGRCLERG